MTAPRTAPQAESWERLLQATWKDIALWAYGCIALAIVVWEVQHGAVLWHYVMDVDNRGSAAAQATPRAALLRTVYFALPLAAAAAAVVLRRRLRGLPRLPTAIPLLAIAAIGVPLLDLRLFEYRNPLLTSVIVIGLALAVGHAAAVFARARSLPRYEIGERSAWRVLVAGWLVFVGWIGFLAHWRFITFLPQPYDMSCETSAVHNLLHTGIPRISVCVHDWFPGQLLPANYASQHVPLIYYLYAPFYALFQDGRTLLWLQAAVMGAGAFGVYMIARRWLGSRTLGVTFGLAYLLNPNVQTVCMHDVHANVLAVPLALIALGLMEARRPRAALLAAFLTCICREETAVYAAAIGLYWALGSRERTRARIGWITLGMSLAILLLLTKVLMVRASGHPRYEHFTFFFDDTSIVSLVKSYVLNPLGALKLLTHPMRVECLWLAMLPLGFLALLGWRAAWSLLIPMGLLFPAASHNFWVAGVNYGVPDIVPVVLLSVMGARRVLGAVGRPLRSELTVRRYALVGFLAVTAIAGSVLYGHILGKSYKLEFGSVPYRNTNEYDYAGELAISLSLPVFGTRERAMWEVISRVPSDGPISATWRVHAQLANRQVAMLYPELGENHAKVNLAKYVVVDRLPPMIYQPEDYERKLRADPRFEVMFENASGVIFRRKALR